MKIAAQGFTIRRELEADPEAALARLRAGGFEYIELAGLSGFDAAQMAGALRSAAVTPIAMHVSLERLRLERQAVLSDAALLELRHLVVPSLGDEQRDFRLDDYRRAGAELDVLASDLRCRGIGLHFHNHASELLPLEGIRPLEVLLDETGAQLGFELDVGWVRVAGQDPLAWVHRLAGRLTLVHLKDVAFDYGSHAFRPLGAGVIDWARVLIACRAAGVEWGIVEDDDAIEGPYHSLELSRAHLEAQPALS